MVISIGTKKRSQSVFVNTFTDAFCYNMQKICKRSLLCLVHNRRKAVQHVVVRNRKSIQNNLDARRDTTQCSNRLRVYSSVAMLA